MLVHEQHEWGCWRVACLHLRGRKSSSDSSSSSFSDRSDRYPVKIGSLSSIAPSGSTNESGLFCACCRFLEGFKKYLVKAAAVSLQFSLQVSMQLFLVMSIHVLQVCSSLHTRSLTSFLFLCFDLSDWPLYPSPQSISALFHSFDDIDCTNF
jgi:hypothetical protein